MNLADELRKLQDLHRSGALTDEEFAAAKAAVLAGGENRPGDEVVREQLGEMQRENEVARLDREWQFERQRYMIAGRYGYSYIPTKGMSVIGGVVIVGFGILWTVFAFNLTGGFGGPFGGLGAIFPLFGVVFVLAGLGASIYSYSRAVKYEEAYQAYQERRARLLGEREGQDNNV